MRVFQAILNFRMVPDTGALAGNDTAPSDDGVTGVAYDLACRRRPATTTLFGIDTFGTNSDQLVRVGGVDGAPSADGGQVTPVGPLGFNLTAQDVGFDIVRHRVETSSNTRSPTSSPSTSRPVRATLVESMGIVMRSIAIVPPDNCPGVSGDNQADLDGDEQGDACDGDIDGDEVSRATPRPARARTREAPTATATGSRTAPTRARRSQAPRRTAA